MSLNPSNVVARARPGAGRGNLAQPLLIWLGGRSAKAGATPWQLDDPKPHDVRSLQEQLPATGRGNEDGAFLTLKSKNRLTSTQA